MKRHPALPLSLAVLVAAGPLAGQQPAAPPNTVGQPLPSAAQRKADLELDRTLGAKAANVKGDTDANGNPVSGTTKKGLVLIQLAYLQNLIVFRNQIAMLQAGTPAQKSALVGQLRQQAPAVRDAYQRLESATRAFNPLKPELSYSNQKATYEATLKQAEAAAKRGDSAEAVRLRQRAAELPYANFLAVRDAFYKALDANPLLGVRVEGRVFDDDFFFKILTEKIDYLASNDSLIPLLEKHLQAFADQTSKEVVRVSEFDELTELFELGDARFGRVHDKAAALSPLAKMLVGEVRAATEGVTITTDEKNQVRNAGIDLGLGILTAVTLYVPVLGQVVAGTVTAIQVYRDGADLVVALVERADVENAAGVIGYVQQVQAGEKVEDAAFKALLSAGLGALDVAGVADAVKQIKLIRRGDLARESAAALERGVAKAREFGVPDESIERLRSYIDPTTPGELLGRRSQKVFEGVGKIDDLKAAALAAGADPRAVEAALDRARNARSIEGLQKLQTELGVLEADAKGAVFLVDPSQQQAFRDFVGGAIPRNVLLGDIVAAEDLRTALTFLAEGKRARLTDAQLQQLRTLLARPDAGRFYRYSPKDGALLRIFDEEQLDTARRLLQSPDLTAIVRGEAALAKRGAAAARAAVSDAVDAGGILNRIDGAALDAFPRAGVPGDAAFFKANGLQPVKTVKVGDQTFHLSKPFKGPGDRVTVIAFHEGADGKVVPRTFYLSGEHGVFRAATGYDDFSRLIHKGPSKLVDAAKKEVPAAGAVAGTRFVNESAADVAAELQGPLSRLVGEQGVAELADDVAKRAFSGHLEAPRILPNDIPGEPREFAGFVRRSDAEIPLPTSSAGARVDADAGLIDRYTLNSPVYGPLEGFVYRSVDGQTTYVVLRDARGNVFVPSVQKSSSGLTPFGTRQQAYKTNLNTTPKVHGADDYVPNPKFRNSLNEGAARALPPPGAAGQAAVGANVPAGGAANPFAGGAARVPAGAVGAVGRAAAGAGSNRAQEQSATADAPPAGSTPAERSTPGLDALGRAIADLPDDPKPPLKPAPPDTQATPPTGQAQVSPASVTWTKGKAYEAPFDTENFGEGTFEEAADRNTYQIARGRTKATPEEFDKWDRQRTPDGKQITYTDPQGRVRIVRRLEFRPGGKAVITTELYDPVPTATAAPGGTPSSSPATPGTASGQPANPPTKPAPPDTQATPPTGQAQVSPASVTWTKGKAYEAPFDTENFGEGTFEEAADRNTYQIARGRTKATPEEFDKWDRQRTPDGKQITYTDPQGRVRIVRRLEFRPGGKAVITTELYDPVQTAPTAPGGTPAPSSGTTGTGSAQPVNPVPAAPAGMPGGLGVGAGDVRGEVPVPASVIGPSDPSAPGTAPAPSAAATVAPVVTRIGSGISPGDREAAERIVNRYLIENGGTADGFTSSRKDEFTILFSGPGGRTVSAEFLGGGLILTDSGPPPARPWSGFEPELLPAPGVDPPVTGTPQGDPFDWNSPFVRNAMMEHFQNPPNVPLTSIPGLSTGAVLPAYQNIVIQVTVSEVPAAPARPLQSINGGVLDRARDVLLALFRVPGLPRAARSLTLLPITGRAWPGEASSTAAPATAPLAIAHDAPGCVVAEQHPRIEACPTPAGSAAKAQVWFRSRDDEAWRTVNMQREGVCFAAALPKPMSTITEFQYFIGMTTREGGLTLAPDTAPPQAFRPRVVKRESDCGRGVRVARGAAKAAQIVINSLKSGSGVPAGFGSEGVVSPANAVGVSLVATGASTGAVFQLQAVNSTGEAVRVTADDALVVQPVQPGSVKPLGAAAKDGARVHMDSVTGYCADFAKPPPPPGTVYRVADASLQQRLRPLRSVIKAGRQLAESGRLHPDSDPRGYADSIKQWAIWTQMEGWDEQGFGRAFVDRTRKNVTDLKKPWTKAIEDAVRGAVPNRWRDITAVLQQARAAQSAP